MHASDAPAVSVLLPARDAGATINVALESVLRSRRVSFEIIVVNHASVDDTNGRVRAVARRDPRVRTVDAPSDAHFSDALEIGRRLCGGRYLARMDADDIMHPHRLAADVAHLDRHHDVVAVASRAKLVPRGAAGRGMAAYVAWQNEILTRADHAREIWIEQPVCHPATTFVAERVDEIGGYRSIAGPEDYDLFFRLMAHGALEKRPVVHHAWREHRSRTTWTSERHTRDAFANVKAAALRHHFSLDGRPLLIAGAGKEGGRIGKALGALGIKTAAYVDVSAKRIGSIRHGAPIFGAAELGRLRSETPAAFAIGAVGTSGARGSVRASLIAAGFTLGRDAVIVC